MKGNQLIPLGASKELQPSVSAATPLGPVETVLSNALDAARDSAVRPSKPMLRYAGFEQTGSVRTYLFDHIVMGQKSTPMVVSANIPLFLKYHVSIQDGPALCLQVLSLAVSNLENTSPRGPSCELTEDDIVAYLASKPRPPEKPKREKPAAT